MAASLWVPAPTQVVSAGAGPTTSGRGGLETAVQTVCTTRDCQ